MIYSFMGHVVVNKDHLLVIITKSKERHKVGVSQLRKHLDFSLKLGCSLSRYWIQTFDGNNGTTTFSTSDATFVDCPKTALPNYQSRVKVSGCKVNFSKRVAMTLFPWRWGNPKCGWMFRFYLNSSGKIYNLSWRNEDNSIISKFSFRSTQLLKGQLAL